MKSKYFIPALVLLALACALPAQSLTVIKPNGGEKLTTGQITQINWAAVGVSQKVKLQLYKADGALVGLIVANLDAAAGFHAWSVGQYASGTAPAGQYLIRVATMDKAIEDSSDAPFTIEMPAPPPPTVVLQLLAPNDGNQALIGQDMRIRWTSSGLSGSNQVELWQGKNRIGVIARNQPAQQGDIAWKAGAHEAGTAPAGPNYRVRIVNSGGPEDSSDKFFTLMPGIATPPGTSQPARIPRHDLKAKPPQFNPQFAPYAVITSFKVDGKDDLSGAKVECRRWQGVLCTASAFSQSQPVLYRFSLYLEDTSENLRHLVKMTEWIQQSSYTFNVSQYAVLDAVFGSNPPSDVPLSLFGSISVEAKNTTQTEPPGKKSIQIKMLL